MGAWDLEDPGKGPARRFPSPSGGMQEPTEKRNADDLQYLRTTPTTIPRTSTSVT